MGSADSILPRALLLTVLVGFLGEGGIVDARVVRVEITHVESPTFAGRSFGDVGLYEKLIGRVFGEVDPEALGNEVIVDLQLAPQREAHPVVEAAELGDLRLAARLLPGELVARQAQHAETLALELLI